MSNLLSRRTRWLIMATLAVGLFHHLDHVLRVDHSGWPFRPEVTPFTYSLAAYPILLFALLGPFRWRWARLGILAAATGFTLWAHTQVETPWMQYVMWAENRSLDPRTAGFQNAFCIQSPALGWAAVTVSLTLNALLAGATLSMLWDTLKGPDQSEQAG
jgi:hypothetical protein